MSPAPVVNAVIPLSRTARLIWRYTVLPSRQLNRVSYQYQCKEHLALALSSGVVIGV